MAQLDPHIAPRHMPAQRLNMRQRGKGAIAVIEKIGLRAEAEAAIPSQLKPIQALLPLNILHDCARILNVLQH